ALALAPSAVGEPASWTNQAVADSLSGPVAETELPRPPAPARPGPTSTATATDAASSQSLPLIDPSPSVHERLSRNLERDPRLGCSFIPDRTHKVKSSLSGLREVWGHKHLQIFPSQGMVCGR